jgi:flagellar assembly protein FliH
MKWSDTILFAQPLQDVRRLTGAPSQEWEALAREREQAAYARGRRDGENALSEQLIQQRAEMAELQKGVLNALSRATPQVIQETEGTLIHLALETAEKIVAGLPISAEMVEAVVREALRQVEDTTEIIVQLHPDDLALLSKHNSSLLNGASETGPLHFVSSPEVTRGGCLVQTRFGLIDARREVKLEQLKRAIST